MRTLAAPLALLFAAAAQPGDPLTLSLDHSATGVAVVDLDAEVGEVEIRGAPVDTVSVRVTLRNRKRWLESSRREEEWLRRAAIVPTLAGSTLRLRLEPRPWKGGWEADWSVTVPATVAIRLDAGVGDVRIAAVGGGITADLGVGDVTLFDVKGDILVDVGVGEVEVTAAWSDFGAVRLGCGVGKTALRTPAGRQVGKGFAGSSLSVNGPGSARLEVDTGVGAVTVLLR